MKKVNIKIKHVLVLGIEKVSVVPAEFDSCSLQVLSG